MYLSNVQINPITAFTPVSFRPYVSPKSFIHPYACVIGNVCISDGVFVAPFASIRGDEGTPIHIGRRSNIQDGVVIHGLKEPHIEVNNKKYSVYIGDNVSLAHQSQIHGPATIGNNVFVGMQSFVFKSTVGNNVVIEPGAKVIGVNVPSNRYIPAGEVINSQNKADNLPVITPDYNNKDLNHEVLEVNHQLQQGYPLNYGVYPPNYYLNSYN